jgi:tryptophan-rich sensory protein
MLAWDVFFALSVISAALVFRGSRLATSVRVLMIISGVLALGGLSGVLVGDMRLRNIGIVGYAGAFPVAALLLAILFHRATPREA